MIIWFLWSFIISVQNYVQLRDRFPGGYIESLWRGFLIGGEWFLASFFILHFAKIILLEKNVFLRFFYHFLVAVFTLFFRMAIQLIVAKNTFLKEADTFDIIQGLLINWTYANFLIYGLIISIYYGYNWLIEYRSSEIKATDLSLQKERLERQLSDANLAALRMQLHPHFLFNTLHSVASLIRTNNSNKAIETLSQLSELLRYTIYENTKNEVTVQEEIQFVQAYLAIEKIRFEDRLHIIWNIDDEVMDYKIPSFSLQPLIENALKHGLRNIEKGILEISIRKIMNTKIAIEIEDNGVGLNSNWTLDQYNGVGLKNTVSRLKNMYGDAHFFDIQNNKNGSGVKVQIIIPAQK